MSDELRQCLEMLQNGDWSDTELCVIHAECSILLLFFANDNSVLNPWNDRVMHLVDLPATAAVEDLIDIAGNFETAEEAFQLTQAVAQQIKARIEQ